MPHFTCNLHAIAEPLPHVWEHTVGSGHAALALRADWQAQLARCHRELGFQHVRFHGILSDPMGTLVDHGGQLRYSFFNADQIWDFTLSIGMRPFVELSFMPEPLAAGEKTVFSYQGLVTPPRDYGAWAKLITKLVHHWVDRYGVAEVRRWFFEVWNEPNLHHFWTEDQAEYLKLYRYTYEAIKEVEPTLRVGGPATAQNAWIPEFLDFCTQHNLPPDFISTHHYPTDAFGEEGDDTRATLAKAERSILRERARRSHEEARGLPLYYTEWNSSSNPRDDLHDRPYAAAFIVKTLLEARGLVEGYSFWTFSDIFAELYMPSEPFHGGFGLLTLRGIPKPTYRAYQLLHHLGKELLPVEGQHPTVDAWTVRGPDNLKVFLTNHALPRHPIQTELVRVTLQGAQEPRAAYLERIDEEHANPRRVWEEMGRPTYPDSHQVAALRAASRLHKEALDWHREGDVLRLDVDIPPHAVAALTLEFPPEAQGAKADSAT